ncbi:MAG: domain S-box, partial [Frankiales bacterium]|nr:domain S-box [Frankiales bacterium]
GAEAGLAALVVAPGVRPDPDGDPRDALVYGVRLDSAFVSDSVPGDGFGVALITGAPPRVSASTNEDPRDDAALLSQVVAALEEPGLAGGRLTQAAGARRPTLHVRAFEYPRGTPLGLLAVTRGAEAAVASQRAGLTALLLSAVATTGVVALLALLLGRRTVQPVRRLTLAAQRVAAGDLTASGPPAAGRDEVGVLSRTFDAMTGSLARLTGDLRSSADRLETVLASMSDGLLATDADGRITSANSAALAMLGLGAPAEVVGRRLVEAVDVRDASGAQLADPALRLQDAPAEVRRPDGSTVPVRVALTALRDADGVVLVLRDTTREREVERMKTEFLSNVSHELRTPLTPIRGYADILASRPGLPPEQVAMFAGTILAESLKMNRVVDLLVDVASIEAGRVQVSPKDVDVRSLLDARLEAWRTRAPERADDLRRRVSAGLPTVHVDATWVSKALDELIDNAVKYTAPGTPITLVAAPAPGTSSVRVSVRDAGPGIPEAAQGSLFTSFEQVDGSATRRVGGLGLGLSFVGRLAEDAGFPLHVESAPGRGSEFSLDLPAGEPLPDRPPVRRRPTARRGPAR